MKWGKNPVEIKVEGGSTLKLDIKKAKISGGYIPEVGDQVTITYDKSKMALLTIRLEYRSADEEAVEQQLQEQAQVAEQATEGEAAEGTEG